jgi:hypothetical protein
VQIPPGSCLDLLGFGVVDRQSSDDLVCPEHAITKVARIWARAKSSSLSEAAF